MSRALLLLNSMAARLDAIARIKAAPWNARVEIKDPKRSLPQNDRLWMLLTAVTAQATWHGEKLTDLEWKDMFTGAVKVAGGGVRAVAGLEGGIMLLGLHTSDMSKAEMVELQDYIESWCAQNGVTIPAPSSLQTEAAA